MAPLQDDRTKGILAVRADESRGLVATRAEPDALSSLKTAPSKADPFFLWILFLTATFARALLAVRSVKNGLFDDAYVSLRYASNLIGGLGFVFNRGERVLGTTSPLNVGILAFFSQFIGVAHLEAIAVTLGLAASIATIYLSNKLLARNKLPIEVTWTYLCILAFLPSFLENTVSGMETPLVVFLMALSLFLESEDRLVGVAVVSILLVLARVDTGIWLICLGVCIAARYGRARFNELMLPLLLFLVGVASWFVFSKIYFGSIIPESIVGKALNHGAFERPDWNSALTALTAYFPVQRLGQWGWAGVLVLLLGLAPSTLDFWRNHPRLRVLVLFFPLYVGTFILGRAPIFSWYEIPPKWAFYLIVVYGFWWWIRKGPLWLGSIALVRSIMAIFALLVVALGFATVWRTAHAAEPESWPRQASDLIDHCAGPNSRVFVEHIGYLGFKTNRYIYDPGGLVSPRTNALKREFGSSWLNKGLKEYKADVVILYPADVSLMNAQPDPDTDWFQRSYSHYQDLGSKEFRVSVYFLDSSAQIRDCDLR